MIEVNIKNCLIIFFIIILIYGITDSIADITSQNNTSNLTNSSGSNTSITGYEATTNYNSGSNPVTNNTTNSNSTSPKNPVSTSTAPSMSVYSQSACVIPLSLGMSTIGFSFSGGNYYVDEACERRKKSELLNRLGMKVASISIMCLDYDVWISMKNSGTSCPIDGLIGKQAEKRWEEVGGFYRTKQKKNKKNTTWNNKPVPSGKINENNIDINNHNHSH